MTTETPAEVLASLIKEYRPSMPEDVLRAWAADVHRALSAGRVEPDGFVLMPRKMTIEMSIAFAETWFSRSRAIDDDDMQDAYDALIESAPPADPAKASGSAPDLLALARGAWRAGITLGNNICVQESDRENDQDGDTGWINGTAECAKRIREWADPEDEQLIELLNEAGVDTAALTATPPASAPEVTRLIEAGQALSAVMPNVQGEAHYFAREELREFRAALTALQEKSP